MAYNNVIVANTYNVRGVQYCNCVKHAVKVIDGNMIPTSACSHGASEEISIVLVITDNYSGRMALHNTDSASLGVLTCTYYVSGKPTGFLEVLRTFMEV